MAADAQEIGEGGLSPARQRTRLPGKYIQPGQRLRWNTRQALQGICFHRNGGIVKFFFAPLANGGLRRERLRSTKIGDFRLLHAPQLNVPAGKELPTWWVRSFGVVVTRRTLAP